MAKEELNQALNCHFEGPVSNGGGKDAFHSVPLSKPGQGEIRDAVESVLTGTVGAMAEALLSAADLSSRRRRGWVMILGLIYE